ncbi:MAG: hypothetical protein AAF349_11995 [Cyanobacteria bacterium P01_A01_bin.68]
MSENQPREFDAVLGGNTPPPVTGVVLGGIEGVKRRLESESFNVRLQALSDALNYQEAGLNLVIQALGEFSLQEKNSAARLLKRRGDEKGKQALLEFDPYLYFTKLDDWEVEEFNPEVGITNPNITAFAIDLEISRDKINTEYYNFLKSSSSSETKDILKIKYQSLEEEATNKKFQVFIDASRKSQIQGLHCYYHSDCFLDLFVEYKNHFSDLRALLWADAQYEPYRRTSKYKLSGNMSLILENYPNLEVFHIRTSADGEYYRSYGGCLSFTKVKHENLKTLVIETGSLQQLTMQQLIKLDLPNLEYLELWFGDAKLDANKLIKNIAEKFTKLKYLGIRTCQNSDDFAKAIVSFTLIERLIILNFSMGDMTNKGAEYLLNCSAVNQLHTLDISMNILSSNIVDKFSKFKCQVYTHSQDEDETGMRYWSLSE